jgi:hypothetical protein
MRAGRSRWKIENEVFNTLKHQGYNFGSFPFGVDGNFIKKQYDRQINFILLFK